MVFATSGTLLLCFVDVSGRLAGLRRAMRTTFIGEPSRLASPVTCFCLSYLLFSCCRHLEPPSNASTAKAEKQQCLKATKPCFTTFQTMLAE